SSRRRHTRSDRDWSSDVCSSDLDVRWPPWLPLPPRPPWPQAPRILSEHLVPLPEPLACLLRPGAEAPPALVAAASARALLDLARSEERRVGKEGRAGARRAG